MRNPQKRRWLLQGYDGLEPMFQRKLSSSLSEKEISALLQRLAARDLSIPELMGASLRKSMKGYNSALEVRRETRERIILSCGSNPHYVASQHTEYEFQTDPDMSGIA